MNDRVIKYDGSFEGFLTCIFHIYAEKLNPVHFLSPGKFQNELFCDSVEINTNSVSAKRVYAALKKKTSKVGLRNIERSFLSEKEDIELTLYEVISLIFSNSCRVDTNYSHHAVLKISQIAKKVAREKHRMEAFVRFRLTKDDIYFATIEPDFNVLPIIKSHFEKRYADQRWIIYDVKRKYGLYFDLQKTEYISLELPKSIGFAGSNANYFASEEAEFQKLWQTYFSEANIKSRVNKKLHLQHVPKRYWKYLSEKSPFQ